MSITETWLGTARLPFLVFTPVCVLLGVVCAQAMQPVSPWAIALVLCGALGAHISVNAFNEVLDFRSGLDALTVKTPFSGGSGTLIAHPELVGSAWVLAYGSLLICVLVGIYFVVIQGVALLPIGLMGVTLVLAYTRAITRVPMLCLMAPGLGFGPLMVLGTQLALTGHTSIMAWVASLVPFFLANNLLLLNQFPDAEADRQVGRRHLVIVAGCAKAARWYAAQAALAHLCLITGVLTRTLPWGAAAGLVMLPLTITTARQVLIHAGDTTRLLPAMARNVQMTLLTPTLMALGLWLT